MFGEDSGITKRVSMVKKSLVNVFEDTSPDWQVLDGREETTISPVKKSPKKRSAQASKKASQANSRMGSDLASQADYNPYEKVPNMPARTSSLAAILAVLSRFELYQDPKFRSKLESYASMED